MATWLAGGGAAADGITVAAPRASTAAVVSAAARRGKDMGSFSFGRDSLRTEFAIRSQESGLSITAVPATWRNHAILFASPPARRVMGAVTPGLPSSLRSLRSLRSSVQAGRPP
ncbi:hypothetical protein GCM10009630_02350 [Kribbella jejuensis]